MLKGLPARTFGYHPAGVGTVLSSVKTQTPLTLKFDGSVVVVAGAVVVVVEVVAVVLVAGVVAAVVVAGVVAAVVVVVGAVVADVAGVVVVVVTGQLCFFKLIAFIEASNRTKKKKYVTFI